MLTAIGDVMRTCYARGWITTRDGNISLRKAKSRYLYITPSGWRKNIIHPEHIIKIPYSSDGSLLVGDKKPSGELHMHWLLQDSDKTRSVVHVHATHCVAAMYAGWDLSQLAADFPEVFRYTKVGPNVPILPATSKELGDATAHVLTRDKELQYDIVGQDRHGVCAIGRNPWEAFEHVERLDHVCEIVLKSCIRAPSLR